MGQLHNERAAVRLIRIVVVVALGFGGSTAGSQETSAALSLDEAVSIGLGAAPDIAATTAVLEGAKAGQTGAGRLPTPELIAAFDNVPVTTDERFSLTRDFMTMQRIGVMQSFPNRHKRELQEERAAREVELAEAQLRERRFATARAIADAWISSAVAEQSFERLQALRPDIEAQAAAANAALASGRGSAADALRTQGLLAGIEDQIMAFNQEAQIRRAELARWIGNDADRPLAPIPADRELAHTADAVISAVPEHAPLAPLVAQVAASQTEVALARAEKRPDWSAEFGYANRGPDFSDMISLEFRIGLPLLSARRLDPVIAQQVARARAQESELDAEVRMHTAEVRAMLANYRVGRQRLQLYETDVLPLARDRVRLLVDSYGAGRGDLQSVFQALSDAIDQELTYVELQGVVARAWTFLQLLHDSATPGGTTSQTEVDR
jgi:cobalt-zinc-cadmium efflux system outer membrane protein